MGGPFGQYNLISALDRDEWSATRPIRLSSAKDSLTVSGECEVRTSGEIINCENFPQNSWDTSTQFIRE
jgi:hypothetical protein